jgi:hypothetical protein
MSESETPLVQRDGKWFFSCPPNSELLCRRYFDPKYGYCVALAFRGGSRANYMTRGYARSVAQQLRDGQTDRGLLGLSDAIDAMADEMEFHSRIWVQAGRPEDGIDSQTVGHA